MYIFIQRPSLFLLKGKSSSDTKSMQEKKETPDNGDGLGTLLSSFATSTTAHGVGRIAGSSDYKFKVSWFLVWLGVVIGFIFMVIKLSLLYKSKPVSTSISMSYEEVMLWFITDKIFYLGFASRHNCLAKTG